jgi:hypothetical protein
MSQMERKILMQKKYIGTKMEPTKQDEVLVTLNVLDRELARLDSMDKTNIVENWNLIDWRKRRNAILNATDKLSKKKEL